jgi:hypothetical protein
LYFKQAALSPQTTGVKKMKALKPFIVLFIAMFILSACTGTAIKPYEKYNLDDQLTPASEILRYNLMDWEAVDSRSFILQTAPSRFYLVVLTRPSDRLLFTETISISHTGAMVKPGYDKVTVYGAPSTETFVISKIYRFENREQANAVKKQLRGK